ncbi:MAG: IS1595 family transposase [Candidatus Brocadia sp.]|nr:IS1595 family transposase [Candidatus Brocadia sp.]
MEWYPTTIIEFEKSFATEQSCHEYLYRIRWPEGFVCPHCNHHEYWITKGRYRCKRCRYWISATAGTIFQDTRIPLQVWFLAIWQVVSQKHGISALGLQHVLGFNRYETIWTMMHKLRIAMVRPGHDRLVGPVQVDETYIGGKCPGKLGRSADGKTLVVVAVEDRGKRPGRIRLHKVNDASGQSLIPAIIESIQPNSEVFTDAWEGYSQLASSGYKHRVLRKTSDVGKNLLPLVNLVASFLKRWLQGTHQGSPRASHLEYYLNEFVFRFNRRTSRSQGLLFYRLIQHAVNVDPVKGQDIRGVS